MHYGCMTRQSLRVINKGTKNSSKGTSQHISMQIIKPYASWKVRSFMLIAAVMLLLARRCSLQARSEVAQNMHLRLLPDTSIRLRVHLDHIQSLPESLEPILSCVVTTPHVVKFIRNHLCQCFSSIAYPCSGA